MFCWGVGTSSWGQWGAKQRLLKSFLFYFLFIFSFLAVPRSTWDLVSRPGLESAAPALGARSLNPGPPGTSLERLLGRKVTWLDFLVATITPAAEWQRGQAGGRARAGIGAGVSQGRDPGGRNEEVPRWWGEVADRRRRGPWLSGSCGLSGVTPAARGRGESGVLLGCRLRPLNHPLRGAMGRGELLRADWGVPVCTRWGQNDLQNVRM